MMVRDLVDAAINMVRTEREDEVYPQAEQRADERLLDLLLPPAPPFPSSPSSPSSSASSPPVFVVTSSGQARAEQPVAGEDDRRTRSREKLREMLADGRLDDRERSLPRTSR
jgi:ATP-dependent HslUV protease ATP-binding subunit HslU